jgi:hypothetical protein
MKKQISKNMEIKFMHSRLALALIFFATHSNGESSCNAEKNSVSILISEKLARKIYNNEATGSSKAILAEAAGLGEPLSLFLLASDDELPVRKRLAFLELAAAIEDESAIGALAILVEESNISGARIDYQFEILRNAVRINPLYLLAFQKFALRSTKRHHWVAAIFWSIVLSDLKNNSMGAVQERANAKLLEAKLAKPQLNELRTRALLFRCERESKVVEITESGTEWR